MNSANMPPWDTQLQPTNPLDTDMLFLPQEQDIFYNTETRDVMDNDINSQKKVEQKSEDTFNNPKAITNNQIETQALENTQKDFMQHTLEHKTTFSHNENALNMQDEKKNNTHSNMQTIDNHPTMEHHATIDLKESITNITNFQTNKDAMQKQDSPQLTICEEVMREKKQDSEITNTQSISGDIILSEEIQTKNENREIPHDPNDPILVISHDTQNTLISATHNSNQEDIKTEDREKQIEIKETNTANTQVQNIKATSKEHKEMIALALKYRPKTFAELVGQESVSRTLCLALDSHKIANAYLFSGLRGSGKTSSARILARCLQCQTQITSTPCGTCANCLAALKGSHIDIIELDGASNRKIDDIRDVIEQTKYKPTIGRFKIFIIDEVHMLTKEAFNALLKTLEEPPKYVKFILATTDPLKIPPTILSRTQHFRFKKIPTNALRNHLSKILQIEGVQADIESLNMLIRNGHGSLRDTLTLLDQAIVFCENNLNTKKLADMLGSLDPNMFDTLFQALLRKNMNECLQFVRSLEGYEAEMILDELSLYIKNKMLEEIPQIPPILGMRYANIINDSKMMLQLDSDGDFCLLLTILKMFEAQKIKDIDLAIKYLESANQKDIMQLTQDTAQTLNIQNNNANDKVENLDQNTQIIAPQTNTQTDNKDNLHNALTKANPLFLHFIQKLYERDYEIGNIFENKISFERFEANILYLTFYTTEAEREILKQGYAGIMQLAREIFGQSTKLEVQKKSPDDLELLLKPHISQITMQTTSNEIEVSEHKNAQPTKEENADDEGFLYKNNSMIKSMQDKLGIEKVQVLPPDMF